MSGLFRNIRFYILVFSFLYSVGVYYYIQATIASQTLQIIRLTQIYALSAVTMLWLALMVTPVTRLFLWFPFRGAYDKARRALGVSAFYFATLHATLAFFFQLGGFMGLFFLPNNYLLAVALGDTAYTILLLLALTSSEFMIKKLTYAKWKFLHKFVYLAAMLIVIHALLLGTHFQDISGTIPTIFFAALSILLILEAIRFDRYLQQKFPNVGRMGLATFFVGIVVIVYYILQFVPIQSGVVPGLGIHALHIQLAKQAQQGNVGGVANLPNIPSLQGDRTRRYTVTFDHPESVLPNKDTQLSFKVYDASSGNPVLLFGRVYEKPMHLIIVDSELNYFNHIHPEQIADAFVINTTFPHDGRYHLYLDFQPIGAIEQQFGFVLDVGSTGQNSLAEQKADTNLTKTVGKYEITLSKPELVAKSLSIGDQKLTFTIKEAQTKQPVTTLFPYLASFGHLVMINEKTYDYLHVHPTNLVAPKLTDRSGPDVSFLPLGIYGPIKPGTYRVFGQFNPNGELITADFTVKVN